VIECDENQHGSYSCEIRREMEILKALDQPVHFVRFNPDAYVDAQDNRHKSCFEQGGRECTDKDRWAKRVKLLVDIVRGYLERAKKKDGAPVKTYKRHVLFYDGFDPSKYQT